MNFSVRRCELSIQYEGLPSCIRLEAVNRTGCNEIFESGASANDVIRCRVRDAQQRTWERRRAIWFGCVSMYTPPVLKICSVRNVNYTFSALAVYISEHDLRQRPSDIIVRNSRNRAMRTSICASWFGDRPMTQNRGEKCIGSKVAYIDVG